MAVHNGFDNRFYVNVWERKQDRLSNLIFEVWSYFNLFSLCPTNFCLVAILFIQRRTCYRLLLWLLMSNNWMLPNWAITSLLVKSPTSAATYKSTSIVTTQCRLNQYDEPIMVTYMTQWQISMYHVQHLPASN